MSTLLLQDAYRRFAEVETRRASPIYEDWALGVADDDEIAALIADLPGIKQQPNLVFAAARHLGAPATTYSGFRDWLQQNWSTTKDLILARSTQTNEAARCALLLPVLSRLEGPLSLIEAGASAGLCLHPDRYSYRYDTGTDIVALDPADGPSDVVLSCTIPAEDAPTRLPEVTWRAGVDINPLDVSDRDELAWLDTLIWPEHEARRARLRAAARIAARHPTPVVSGDLLTEVPRLIDEAPPNTSIVVFHCHVLVYLSADDRTRFARIMRDRPHVTWISNEGQGVLPDVTEQVTEGIDGRTILAVNGRATALVAPHGGHYRPLP